LSTPRSGGRRGIEISDDPDEAVKWLRRELKKKGVRSSRLMEMLDGDRSGTCSFNEFFRALDAVGIDLPKEVSMRLFRALHGGGDDGEDTNASIPLEEVKRLLFKTKKVLRRRAPGRSATPKLITPRSARTVTPRSSSGKKSGSGGAVRRILKKKKRGSPTSSTDEGVGEGVGGGLDNYYDSARGVIPMPDDSGTRECCGCLWLLCVFSPSVRCSRISSRNVWGEGGVWGSVCARVFLHIYVYNECGL
jgi:hypothetical protein